MTRCVLIAATLLAGACAHVTPPAPPKPCLAGPPPAAVKLLVLQDPEELEVENGDGERISAVKLLTTKAALGAYLKHVQEVQAYADGAWTGCSGR